MTAIAPPALCLITDRRRLCASAGRPLAAGPDLLVAQAEAAGACGVTLFQIREGDLGGAALLELAGRIRAVAGEVMRVVVNDRADVAVVLGLGLHLKAASIPEARLRTWLPPATWISAAVHGPADVDGPSGVDLYIAGTVRRSRSKGEAAPLLGYDGLAAVVRAAARPVLGVGGLSAEDWPAARAAGAAGIAAIGFFLPRTGESASQGVQRAASAWKAATGQDA